MNSDTNILKQRDRHSLSMIENAFLNGPLAQDFPEIERRKGITAAQFETEHRKLSRPVVLEGYVNDWPSVQAWSFDALADKCADVHVTVDSYNSQRAHERTFSEFVNLLHTNLPPAAPLYLQEWYYQTNCPALTADLPEIEIAQYDFRQNLYGRSISTNHQLWIGQKGGITRLHQDSYMMDVMHAQIIGQKKWTVISPDAYVSDPTDFFRLAQDPDTSILQCTLNPGDLLYLPAQWWHRIELTQDSVGLGRKCLDERHLQSHIHQRMAELLSLLLNQDEIKEMNPELFNVVMSRNRAWAQRMNIDLKKLRP